MPATLYVCIRMLLIASYQVSPVPRAMPGPMEGWTWRILMFSEN